MKILKINTLEKGWYDKDHVLLHAAFQVLADFIEKEKPDKTIDWNWNKANRKAWKEMNELYHWWTKKRPKRQSPIDDKKLKIPPFKFKSIPGSKYKTLAKPNKKKFILMIHPPIAIRNIPEECSDKYPPVETDKQR